MDSASNLSKSLWLLLARIFLALLVIYRAGSSNPVTAFAVQGEKAPVPLLFAFSIFSQLGLSSPCVFLLFPQFPGFVFPAHLKFSCTSPSILVRLHRFLDVQLLLVHGSSSKLIPAVFIPSPGGSFHTFLFPVSLLLALRCHPRSLERARKETDGAAVLATDGGAGHVPCHGNECCVLALVASSPQSHALTLLLCPHRRRCSCTAASSCAGRWTRPRAAPRAAGDARAGRPSNGSRRRRRNLLTWQTTS